MRAQGESTVLNNAAGREECCLCPRFYSRGEGLRGEENEVLRHHSWEGIQVYTEWDKGMLSSCGLGSIKIAALGTKGITRVLIQLS